MENLADAILKLNDTLNVPPSATWSEWALVCITAVYVLATIAICFFNYRSAKAIREQVQESKRQFDETNRPNIDVTHEIIRGGLICLKIENTGRKLAQHIRLTINDNFIQCTQGLFGNSFLTELKGSVFSLGIGQKWFIVLCGPQEITRLYANLLEIDISYEADRQTYTGHVSIDFSQYKWTLIYDSPLDDISQHQKKISEALSHIERLLEREN